MLVKSKLVRLSLDAWKDIVLRENSVGDAVSVALQNDVGGRRHWSCITYSEREF